MKVRNLRKGKELLALISALLIFLPNVTGCSSSARLANSNWFEIETSNFRIVTDGSPRKVEKLATDLEKFRYITNKYLGNGPDNQKLTIFALSDKYSFREASRRGESLGNQIIGTFNNTSYGSFALIDLTGNSHLPGNPARETLFHEYTHFLTYARSSQNIPYWYSEGIAELFSTVQLKGKKRFELGKIPIGQAYSIRQGRVLPLEKLLMAKKGSLNDEEFLSLYSSGWMLTHWMLFDSNRRQALLDYLNEYNNGTSTVNTLADSLNMSLEELEVEYQQLPRSKFGYFTSTLEGYDANIGLSINSISPQIALREIARYISITQQSTSETQEFIRSTGEDGFYDKELDIALASSEISAGNFTRASKILSTIPKEFHSKNWFIEVQARASLSEEMAAGPAISMDRLSDIRDQYIRLIELDDSIAAYWHGLAISMQVLGSPRSSYLEMLEQAYLRAPRDLDIAWWYAHELYIERDKDYFAEVSRPLLMQITNQDSQESLRAMLRELQQQAGTFESDSGLVNMITEYRSLPGIKALAIAIDHRGALSIGYIWNRSSQEQANQEALSACEKHNEHYRVLGKCHLYAEGNQILVASGGTIRI
ncbi:hypothetical protein [Microbulbifer sp. JMSA003]|uniref:hypothetical protein n=1 Tax=Microbulbifer sp. JMSA003 TaxID=3243369 RepID=UPI00403A6D4B